MSRANQPSKPLGRRTGSRRTNRRYLVFCEGEVTEEIYLEGLKQELRNAGVKIVVGPKHCEPLGLVRAAIRHAAQFGKDAPEAFDEIWCVFDIEAPIAHGSLGQALRLAEGSGVKCAISGPCFELWLLLHFREQRGYLTTDKACSLLESGRHCGYTVASKRFDFAAVWPHRDLAQERAVKLAAQLDEALVADRNPWTDFHRLVEALMRGSSGW